VKQLGIVVTFNRNLETGVIKLNDGSELTFTQDHIGDGVKGTLLVSKKVMVYYDNFDIINIKPMDSTEYKEVNKEIDNEVDLSSVKKTLNEAKTALSHKKTTANDQVVTDGSQKFDHENVKLHEPNNDEEKWKGYTWISSIIFIPIVVAFFMIYDHGFKKVVSDPVGIFKEMIFSEGWSCNDVANLIKRNDWGDQYGEDYKILSIANFQIVSETTNPTKLICSASLHIEGERKRYIHMYVESEPDPGFSKSAGYSYGFESTPTEYLECSQVADLVKDMNPGNIFGKTYDILSIKNTRLVSKDSEKIICSGTVHLSDNTKTQYNMIVEQSDEGQIYGIEKP
jgi:hypothetical protein